MQDCDPASVRLDELSFKLHTGGCPPTTYCASNGSCLPKLCRKDQYPFGYPPTAPLPPLCPPGQFCADEEDTCRPVLPPGALCQMNRDDECAPPASSTAAQALCLNFTCTIANAMLGAPCTIDFTRHVTALSDGRVLSVPLSRDTCRTAGFCDASDRVCVPTRPQGAPCSGDWMCISKNCDDDREVCVDPPGTPNRLATGHYVLTALTIVIGMVCVCAILVMLDARHRARRRQEVEEYYREQTSYRNAINALIAAVTTDAAALDEYDHYYANGYDDDDESGEERVLLKRKGTWKFRID